MTQPVDLFVDLAVFLDKSIGARDIGLRLVIIKITDEIVDGVVGKEVFEFAVQLGGEGFVVAEYQGRLLVVLNDIGHRKRLSRTSYAQERLVA